MRTVRAFFERIIEWDWPDAPPRNPVIAGDIPKKPEPLPKFLDDRDAARLMAAARASADPRDRLVVELLARTGMRAGELAGLDADAVVQIGAGHWLRIPLGKLRNDRYVPAAPRARHTCSPPGPPPTSSTSAAASGWSPTTAASLDRHVIGRIVAPRRPPLPASPVCTRTGCATRWPPRPSTAACGWRPSPPCSATSKMEMTLIYARIANRVVGDEYAAVSTKIDALYGRPPELPAGYETTGMARLRREAHARMLGNGLCTRPAQLDCRLESACETCGYFRTGTEFLPILIRQRDHAQDHGQADRATLFDGLIQRAEAGPATTERS